MLTCSFVYWHEQMLDHPVMIAAVQDTPVYLDKNATVEKACELIQEAASNGAKLVVFPEVFISGYPDWVWVLPPEHKDVISKLYGDLLASAVSIPDEAVDLIGKAAKAAGVYVSIGANERNSEASIQYNLVFWS